MCEQNQTQRSQDGHYWRTIFDSLPLSAFIVDEDVRISDYNAAAASFLGPNPATALHQRGGDVMGCINAQASGCGRGSHCRECVIRNSVTRAVLGQKTHRQIHKMELETDGRTTVADVLITATRLPGAASEVLLLMEDVSELLTLRGLIPICAHCKKVRNDKQYWESIDMYLYKNMNLKLSHGICPTCYAEQMKALEALRVKPDPVAVSA
jgi:hypothetical protein